MLLRLLAPLAFALGLASCATSRPLELPEPIASAAARPLKLASWNLEFLAERNGAGCAPRSSDDYAAMRKIAESLDADVIAFQEAENEAAAARVFDPDHFAIVMETRPGAPSGSCGGHHPDQQFIRQAVGFAVRRTLAFDRNPDLEALMLRNPQLRSGVDITLRPAGQAPIRLLAVHLKSGCFQGTTGDACSILVQQMPIVEEWIDRAAAGPMRFAVLGDWNRRLAVGIDLLWKDIDDSDPPNADLRLADEGTAPACDPRYSSFIDHIVLDKRAGADMTGFSETLYAPNGKHYSDHCPIAVTLAR